MSGYMDEAVKRILDDHENRLEKLEGTEYRAKKTSKGKSIMDLLIEIKDEDFFSKKRTPKEILHRFSEKGHTYKRTQSLTAPLQRATKKGLIHREKVNDEWMYYV